MTNIIKDWVDTNHTRYLLPQGSNFYVDTVNGNDCNDGLSSSNACKTIQNVINQIYTSVDCAGQQPAILVLPGSTVTEQVSVFGQVPGARPQLYISSSDGSKLPWILQGDHQAAVQARDNGICTVQGFSFSAGGHSGCVFLNPSQQGVIDYCNVDFGDCINGYHIYVDHGGSCNCLSNSTDVTISGSAGSHILMGGIGASHCMGGATINIAPGLNFYNFIQAAGQCMLNWSFCYFSGSPISGSKYSITMNAVFIKNGTTIPGSGTTVNTGGQVY